MTPAQTPTSSPASKSKHTLLVVDDEPDVCDSVHDLLRRHFKVVKARNAEDAIALLGEHEIDIIMTDQRMPKITGVELLTKVRCRHPQAVRMLFTGYADLESIITAINQGHIFRFIRKPWQPEELEFAVKEAAEEYDRLVAQAEELSSLRHEIESMQQRITALEKEVTLLRG